MFRQIICYFFLMTKTIGNSLFFHEFEQLSKLPPTILSECSKWLLFSQSPPPVPGSGPKVVAGLGCRPHSQALPRDQSGSAEPTCRTMAWPSLNQSCSLAADVCGAGAAWAALLLVGGRIGPGARLCPGTLQDLPCLQPHGVPTSAAP